MRECSTNPDGICFLSRPAAQPSQFISLICLLPGANWQPCLLQPPLTLLAPLCRADKGDTTWTYNDCKYYKVQVRGSFPWAAAGRQSCGRRASMLGTL